MSWQPPDNRFDGVGASPIDGEEINAPYYKWDLYYTIAPAPLLFPPLISTDPTYEGGVDEDGNRVHNMRLMIVPPERGRC